MDLANMAEANRLVIQDMPDGVLVVDELGIIRQHNPSAERLLGRHFQDVQELTLEECAPELAGRLALWRHDPGRKYEPLTLTNLPYQTQARFLSVQRETFWGAVVFLEDMQRVQAQAQQIKLAALGRLTANIAHEVRNPLSAISYAAELLREEKHDPAQARLFEVILENTTRLDNIVRDVMQLNRRDRAQREKINLADKLRGFVENIRLTENVAEDVFLFEIVPDCQIDFDPGHLDQVLWNLFRNALRYCQGRPRSVQLQAWKGDKGQVILDVINDGPRISPDVIQKLFEPFFTTAAGGTGLGLYIARELCDANGAKLEYREEGLKTCFRIQFADPNELSFQ
ncbi:MAG: ATP-binding protein [Candidatus Nitrotoga sp.]